MQWQLKLEFGLIINMRLRMYIKIKKSTFVSCYNVNGITVKLGVPDLIRGASQQQPKQCTLLELGHN